MRNELEARLQQGFPGGNGSAADYHGESYYGLPAVKHSHYRWLIIVYFFLGGLAAASQFIATVIDLLGRRQDRPLVRAGRYIALAGALVSPGLLAADLLTPGRWYNMLRIFRRTSAMSIGSWTLTAFGTFSGIAAVGQAMEDLFGWRLGRWLARLASVPAALAGGIVALYTGTLLAATSVPLWGAAFPFLSSLFASSAASSATATLALVSEAARVPETTRRRLDLFAILGGLAELFFTLLIDRQWRKRGAGSPMRQPPFSLAYQGIVRGAGILAPLAVHSVQLATGRHSRLATVLASLAALLGSFSLRAVMVLAGKPSAQRPEDYFRFTQVEHGAQERRRGGYEVQAMLERRQTS